MNDEFSPTKPPKALSIDGKPVFMTLSMAEIWGFSEEEFPRFVESFSYNREAQRLNIRLFNGECYFGHFNFVEAVRLLVKFSNKIATDELLSQMEKV